MSYSPVQASIVGGGGSGLVVLFLAFFAERDFAKRRFEERLAKERFAVLFGFGACFPLCFAGGFGLEGIMLVECFAHG